MMAPRWLVVAATLLAGYLVLALVARAVVGGRARLADGFTQVTVDVIYVYMEGCGHCKQFDPTWKAFTERYGAALAAAGVSARKMRNDDPDAKSLGVGGYPTVLLVYKTGADTTPFDGPRTVDGLAAFVNSNVPAFTP